MPNNSPSRRLPLRDLLTDVEKRSRDLVEHMHSDWMGQAGELRDLSRPVRKRSHYPTLLSLLNCLNHLIETSEETEKIIARLTEQLEEIRVHTRRERFQR